MCWNSLRKIYSKKIDSNLLYLLKKMIIRFKEIWCTFVHLMSVKRMIQNISYNLV